jgi:hypothetical protein
MDRTSAPRWRQANPACSLSSFVSDLVRALDRPLRRSSYGRLGVTGCFPHETARGQLKAEGSLVTVQPHDAFRAEDDKSLGPIDEFPEGEFDTGWLTFKPETGGVFPGDKRLLCCAHCKDEANFHAPLIRDGDSGNSIPVLAIYPVIGWPIADGRVAARQPTTVARSRATSSPQYEAGQQGQR